MARMRKKKNLIPRMERAGAYIISEPNLYRGCWREKLGLAPDAALTLELGCGKGAFAVKTAKHYASEESGKYIIALDKVNEALVIGMERAMAENAEGALPVRFVSADASNLSELFAPGEVNTVCVNFCDPWPNKRHYKRRITWDDFLKTYGTLLAEGGTFRFKTDNEPLYDFTLERLEACSYKLIGQSRDLHSTDIPNITTEYEDKFSAMGMPIYFAEAVPPAEFPVSEEKPEEENENKD
ncbi:MAG: tRNA (guanosine(46)-N7)-methyltransferase TrmB [Clostridia bacterium]|nr:tRNA (guanosine(46)-N7)-methyltransferase TrmB [Clostridia bacterium]